MIIRITIFNILLGGEHCKISPGWRRFLHPHSVSHTDFKELEIKMYLKQLFIFSLVAQGLRGKITQLLTELEDLLKLDAQLPKINVLLWLEILKKLVTKIPPYYKACRVCGLYTKKNEFGITHLLLQTHTLLDRKFIRIPNYWIWMFETGHQQQPCPRIPARC